ncbi:MAG: flagellar FliJ family protein [Proteobacteria bacterium]|nr:flagellar FliJ family protein [Pseudomonadota bacterium]
MSSKISKIINIKEGQKKEVEREIKKEKETLKSEEKDLKELKKELDYMKDILDDQIISSNIELYYKYVHTLGEKIDKKEAEVKMLDSKIKEKENDLLHMYREARALNIIKDEVIREELRRVIIEEQKNLDFDYISRKFKK